jgi:hypothetical protein
MSDWSIKIIPDATGAPAAFLPDLHGSKPGDPLQAQEDDLVSWNNTTDKPCQPWPTDSNYKPLPTEQVSTTIGNYLSDEIPAGMSSSPLYDVVMPTWIQPPGNVIYYCCRKNPNVRGTIVVSSIPTALNVPPP